MKFKTSKIVVAATIAISSTTAFSQTATFGGTTSDRAHVVLADTDNSGDGGVFIKSESGINPASFLYMYDAEDNTAAGQGNGLVHLGGSEFKVDAAATTVTGTFTVDGATTAAGITNTGGLTQTGPSALVGATSINATGNEVTYIGTGGGATNIGSAASTNTVLGTTNITGTTSINSSGSLNTTIGNTANTTMIQSGTNIITGANNSMTATTANNIQGPLNNIGTDRIATNNIGTNSAFASTNRLGSENAGASVISRGGNSTMEVANNVVSATVITGTSTLVDATTTTTGQMLIRNTGGTTVDANGKILTSASTGYVNPAAATAAVTLTNGLGNTHGLVVTESQTTLSGGTESSSMTLTDRAATFSNAQNGNPITVTGVADGRADFDAVNVRQFAGAIAAVAAQANIPALAAGQDRTFGMGVGNFMGKSALAMGLSMRGSNNSVYKATVSSGLNNGMKQSVVGVGGAWGF